MILNNGHKNLNEINDAFKHYRQIAIAMSVSFIGISFTVLGWLLVTKVVLYPVCLYETVLFSYITTIISGASVQFFSFQGYKYHARSLVSDDSEEATRLFQKSNRWFIKEDWAVWVLYISFIIGIVTTIVGVSLSH